MSRETQRPTHDEYVEFVEEEFGFLEADYGYVKAWDKEYRRTSHCSLRSQRSAADVRLYLARAMRHF